MHINASLVAKTEEERHQFVGCSGDSRSKPDSVCFSPSGLSPQAQATPAEAAQPARATAGGHQGREEAEAGVARHDPPQSPG